MKLSALLWAILHAVLVSAQPSYMKVFRATGTNEGNLNELSSGSLRIGVARQSGTSLIDPDGNILQSRNYAIDTFLVLQSVKRYTDNDFFFTGAYAKDSCTMLGNLLGPYTYPVFGRMDSMGNILAAYHYVLNDANCMNVGDDLEVMSDGGAVLWGAEDIRFCMLKVQYNGDPIWAKRFSGQGHFRFARELPGGDLIVGVNTDPAGACIARLDPNGNLIWCKSYFRPNGEMRDAVVESDDSFLITGLTSITAPKLFLLKLNGAGEVQWCRGYVNEPGRWDIQSREKIVKAQDGNYVLLATLGQTAFPYFYRPFLMKVNTSGDTLWTRSNGKSNYLYETRSLLAYSDGGFMYNGYIWGDLPEGQANFAFLFKTDSLGHLPCYERYQPIEVVDLFPTDSSFTLTSIDGATVHPAFINEAVYPPIVQYDGCTFTTSLHPMARAPRKMNVRPNPNTGRFTLEFKDPLQAESYYSVYDATGKLLYQRPLPPGKGTEEVDLSRYGKGTYVIKCTDRDGVYHERVVVE